MKRFLLSMLTLLVAVVGTEAKSWKIGPSSVTGMDFASINAAMSSSDVAAGDTLYLDQYYNESAAQTVTKRVVIIGTGYDTALTDEQVVAQLTSTLSLKASKVVVKSVKLSTVLFFSEECVIDRCYATYLSAQAVISGINHIYSCYIEGYIWGYSSSSPSKFDIQNNVIIHNTNSNTIQYLTSSVINNNSIYKSYSVGSSTAYYCLSSIVNTQITNNLIYGYSGYYSSASSTGTRHVASNVIASGSGNTIEHNIANANMGTYYPTNKTYSSAWSNLFTNTGRYSDQYKLATESGDNPAINYATDGGEVGCHGGMFGCPSGGRPQYIPYFTKVTVGSRSENGKLPVSVTVKIQDE
ncbi:MAG: hypothetical protein IJR02_13325 [Bacteroidaceae bacterium]|nr:hypothetical protein [Bacteroidaceae bacterium]